MSSALVVKFAEKFSLAEDKVLSTLKATCFKGQVSDEQMAALMVIADQYSLNPFTKEIYAYPDKNNGIVPVVGVDGWARIINEHPQLDGLEFVYSEGTKDHGGKTSHEWIDCVITRKDRSKPMIVREYFDEVVRKMNFATPWDTHPKRMHRHKALIQCARLAFGFAGIYDPDEAERILEKNITPENELLASDWVDVAPLITMALKTKTDKSALDFWNDKKALLAKQPDDYAKFKQAVIDHRASLRKAPGSEKEKEAARTIEMEQAPVADDFVAAMDKASGEYAPE